MNKAEFLDELRNGLKSLPKEQVDDIIYDYEEHFTIGLESGKTEEEISKSLGEAKTIAKQYRASYRVEKAGAEASTGNIFRAVLAFISLGFFNLIFVLPTFIALFGVMMGLFAGAVGITIGGVAIFASTIFPPLVQYVNMDTIFLNHLPLTMMFSVGLTSLGALFFIGDCYLAKFFYKGTVNYLKFNVKIVGSKR